MARRRQLGEACSKTPRVARGVLGVVVGGVVGSFIGFGVGLLAVRQVREGEEPSFALPLLLPLFGVAGSVAGAWVGARKPDCDEED